MKLKLTTQGTHTILSVTENVTQQQIPVLKAGISKIFQAGKKTVLLDLTQTLADPAIIREMSELQLWAMELGAQLVAVTALRDVGQAGSVAEGIQLLGSQMALLLANETKLKTQLSALEKQLVELDKKLNSVASNENALAKLKKENADLRNHVTELEKEVARRLRNRVDIFESELIKNKMERLSGSVELILGQHQVL